MSIDFEIPPEAKAVRERVRQWVKDECIPAEARLVDKASYKVVLDELRAKARAQGLWLPFVPKDIRDRLGGHIAALEGVMVSNGRDWIQGEMEATEAALHA